MQNPIQPKSSLIDQFVEFRSISVIMDEDEPQILKLPDHVIDRIAAGEVIQRPANAVKELIENSLDAGSTDIKISVKNGGTTFLQIQDNGTGIRQADLELLCQRYTTSKLRKFDDLKSISTYGFRGEALASVSQVSHLTIVTKTSSSLLGFRAEYEGGRLKGRPKPCASSRGTQITVEDLFYNVPDRLQALRSAGEEMKKITDVVTKYAIHNAHVAFALKKQGETMVDLRTPGKSGLQTSDQDPTRFAIGLLYGSPLSRELLPFQCDEASSPLAFTAEGYVSNPAYSAKKYTFILFINHRLVECDALKKSLELLYTNYGSSKSLAPFVYVKIEIEPENVDVNVHPTKRTVRFLYEREIIDALESMVKKTLDTCNVSKSFMVKNFPTQSNCIEDNSPSNAPAARGGVQKKVEPHNMVRTDSQSRKLAEFMDSQGSPSSQNIRVNFMDCTEKPTEKDGGEDGSMAVEIIRTRNPVRTAALAPQITDEEISILYDNDSREPTWRPITLASIIRLQQAVQSRSSTALRSLIANHTLVGCVDAEYALLQYETGLYLVNTTILSQEFFYQLLVFQFGNFGALKLSDRCPLIDLICLAMPSLPDESREDKRNRVQQYSDLLTSRSEMLWDYFALQLVDGYLVSIPWLLDKYVPQLEGLATYIYRLATSVNWQDEGQCFDTFCRETSKFYSFKKEYCDDNKATAFSSARELNWSTLLETVLYPAMKSKLVVPQDFMDRNVIMKLSDVHDLYRVFERC